MTIRPLLPADAAAAAAMDYAVHWSAADYERIARGDFPERFCLVAEEPPGRVGGLLLASVVQGDAEILNLAVEPSLRCRGIAAALIEEAAGKMAAAGAHRVWLEVRESNAPALALYHRFGFRLTGRRCQYYQEPKEDALLLESPLPLC